MSEKVKKKKKMKERKKTLNKQQLFSICIVMLILLSFIGYRYLSPQNPKWKEYPYVIPGTSLEFPLACGYQSENFEIWSIGLVLEDTSGRIFNVIILYNILYGEGTKKFLVIDNSNGDIQKGFESAIFSGSPLSAASDELNIEFENMRRDIDIFKEAGSPFTYMLESYLTTNQRSVVVNLTIDSKKPPVSVFNGSVQHNDGYYYCFALTDCSVKGEMTVDGENFQVEGQAWFERQWGDFTWDWEWWSGHIDDDKEIEIVGLFEKGSNTPFLQYIIYVDENGNSQYVTDVNITIVDYWVSGSGRYSAEWNISSNALQLDINLRAVEFYTFSGFTMAEIVGTGTLENKAIALSLYAELLVEYSGIGEEDSDGDGLSDNEEVTLYLTDPNDWRSPGIYAIYNESYATRKYDCWVNYSSPTRTRFLGLESMVIRRGSTFEISGPPDSEITISTTKDNMNELHCSGGPPWLISVDRYGTIGSYNITITKEGWSKSMILHVIFDPGDSGISEDELLTYCYDENGHRDEYDALYQNIYRQDTVSLHPFGGLNDGTPTVYELALAAVGNTSSDLGALLKLFRLASQRNRANLNETPSFIYEIARDASQIFFFENETIEALTLQGAAKISENDNAIDDFLVDNNKTRMINGWCMEASISMVALARSIGIPARIVTLYNVEGLMIHFIAEAWLTNPPLLENARSPLAMNDHWYVFDADEWCYPVDFGAPTYPILYSVTGDIISPRGLYNKTINNLMYDLYHFNNFLVVNLTWDILYWGNTNPAEPTILNEFYSIDHEYELYSGVTTAPLSLGGGLLFFLNVESPVTIRLTAENGLSPVMLINETDYPGHRLVFSGFPYPLDSNYSGNEVYIEEPGTYFIGIYSYTNPNLDKRGNYELITITVEDAIPP